MASMVGRALSASPRTSTTAVKSRDVTVVTAFGTTFRVLTELLSRTRFRMWPQTACKRLVWNSFDQEVMVDLYDSLPPPSEHSFSEGRERGESEASTDDPIIEPATEPSQTKTRRRRKKNRAQSANHFKRSRPLPLLRLALLEQQHRQAH